MVPGPAPSAGEASAPAARANAGIGARPACPATASPENRTTLLRLRNSRPVSTPNSPVIRSWRHAILTNLLKLNGASSIFTSGAVSGERS